MLGQPWADTKSHLKIIGKCKSSLGRARETACWPSGSALPVREFAYLISLLDEVRTFIIGFTSYSMGRRRRSPGRSRNEILPPRRAPSCEQPDRI
jgi:hypothetical protein